MLMQKFWGVNKMYYGNGENSELDDLNESTWKIFKAVILGADKKDCAF